MTSVAFHATLGEGTFALSAVRGSRSGWLHSIGQVTMSMPAAKNPGASEQG
jgi:hypothetical protein